MSGNGTSREESDVVGDTLPNQRFLRPIKQEQVDETDEEYESNKIENNEAVHPEPTVMTTIPIPQFQISAISSGVEFGDNKSSTEDKANDESSEAATTPHTASIRGLKEDIKPSKAELERFFQITSVSYGVQMEHEEENEIENESDCNTAFSNSMVPATSMVQRKLAKTVHKVVKHKSAEQKVVTQARSAKAFKSTSGVSKANANTNSGISQANLGYVPQIQIKPEPVDRGYEDVFSAYESATNSSAANALQISMREMAEQEYLNNIDFATIQIKQEKDLDVSDVEITNTHIVANAITNGKLSNGEESQYSGNDEGSDSMDNEETDENEEDEDNDDDWVGIKKVEEEKREYRELEMPPLLSTEVQGSNENVHCYEDTFTCTPNLTESRNEDTDDLLSVRQALESGSVEQKKSKCVLSNITSVNEPTTSALLTNTDVSKSSNEDLLAHPLMITAIYSQTDDAVSKKFTQTSAAVTPQDEIGYSHDVNEALVEMQTLKIESVIAGCSTSFDDLSKDDNQLTGKFSAPFAGQLTEVGDVIDRSYIRNNEDSELINDVIDTYPEARMMCIEINQNKDALLDAQPFSNVRTETVSAMGSSQMILNPNINIASDPAQNNPVELVGENLVEEVQNVLNQEVVEAQAIQRLLGADQSIAVIAPTQNVEEAENLMNESVAEAQLEQRQEALTDVQTRSNMLLIPSDLECYESASSSAEGTSQSRMINHTFLLDESNINEIAENNNNANIERELHDDVASTTTTNPNTANSSDIDTNRRNNTDTRDTKITDLT